MKKIYIITLLFLNLIGFSQTINFSENFESGIPSNWATFETGIGTIQSWGINTTTFPACEGSKSAFIDRENVTNGQYAIDWLVTPQITVPANGELRFWTKQTMSSVFGSLYSVRVSTTSQTTSSTFAEVASWNETSLDNPYGTCTEKVVDLSMYPAGTHLYIAFVMQNDSGDRWLVDNVNVAEKCNSVVTYFNHWTINSTTAELTWNATNGVSLFDVQVAPFSDAFGGGTTMNFPNVTQPLNVSGLNPNVLYKFQVRPRCIDMFVNEWFGPRSFQTTASSCPNDFYFDSYNNLISHVYWKNSTEVNNPTLTINGVSIDLSNPEHFNGHYWRKQINYANPTTNSLSLLFKKNANASAYQTFLPYQNILNFTSQNVFCLNDFVTITQPPFGSTPSLPNTSITWSIKKYNTSGSPTSINISNPVQLTQSGIISIIEDIDINTSANNNLECHNIANNKIVIVKNCASCANQNPSLNHIKSKLIALLNHLKNNASAITNGYTCNELLQLSPFITTLSPAIYDFNYSPGEFLSFSFSTGTTTPDISIVFSGNQITNLHVIEYNSSSANEFIFEFDNNSQSLYVKPPVINKINFCKQSCALTNSNSQVINGLLVKLIKKFVSKINAGASDAIIMAEALTYQEFINLAPYITDSNPGIFNFQSQYINPNALLSISFSFSNSHPGFDIKLEGANFNTLLNSSNFLFDLTTYFDPETPMNYENWISDNVIIKSTYIKHINFCSEVPFCAKHIAIVLDESGSFRKDDYETLRLQLRNFINAQAKGNLNSGSNTKVSIIGLSDSDIDGRTADSPGETPANGYHVIATDRLLPTNKAPYLDWISSYGKRTYTSTSDAISKNSDYWASGLQKALTIHADQVILITDGCQSTNVTALKTILSNFTNHNTITSEYKPHLYILGKMNGYYIDESFATNRTNSTINPNDIVDNELSDVNIEVKELDFVENNEIELNIDEELAKESTVESISSNTDSASLSDQTARSASSLLLSLKYLYNLNLTSEVLNFKYDFNKDCFAAQDFLFLQDEKEYNYLYNNLIESRYTCSEKIPVEVCDDCVGFRPNPGFEYIISAWVKQERKDQVINYKAFPDGEFLGIKIKFYKINEDGSVNENYSDSYLTTINCEIIQGEMIEGWQRIFKKFKMPEPSYPYVIRIVLENNDNAKPCFFDDIRIHPVDSNLKSFVYDAETNKLMVELDENNFGTFYEYDKEGGLIRVKKETSKGIKTIQETRQSNTLRN